MALFGRKDRTPLFGKQKKVEDKKPTRHELVDIPLESIIEFSDITTFELTGDTSGTLTLFTRKKYEGNGLLRYMYHTRNTEGELVLGVDHIAGTKDEYEVSRWIVDSEQELTDPLPDEMTLYYQDPENQDGEIAVIFHRQEIVPAKLTVVNVNGEEQFETELHEYINDSDEFMSIELCGNWLTFYVGFLISRSDIEIYPSNVDEYIRS